jgi:hypothetical protein
MAYEVNSAVYRRILECSLERSEPAAAGLVHRQGEAISVGNSLAFRGDEAASVRELTRERS